MDTKPIFPLKDYKHEIPTGDALGAFGVTRKHDMHTGVDLYCNEGDEVRAMCDGQIVAIEWFTGPSVQMPWWNDTNITTQLRGQLIDLFESYGGKVKITYVEVPYKTLIQQNSNREAAVPLPVIERMIGKLEIPQYDEAFDIDYFVK